MILNIKYTKDKGTPKERVVLSVIGDGEIGIYFALKVKKLESNELTNQVSAPFWFPDTLVKKGDLVVLYTKVGKSGFRINKDSSKTYFFYRNFDHAIFEEHDTTLLLEGDWQAET